VWAVLLPCCACSLLDQAQEPAGQSQASSKGHQMILYWVLEMISSLGKG
jgi:hypothetical protein